MKELRNPKDVILRDGIDLQQVLDLHKRWLEGKGEGKKAKLINEDLSYVDLRGVNLKSIKLYNCYLSNSNLSKSDLSYSDLFYSDLSLSDLRYSNLSNSDLSNSDLSSGDLRNSNLSNSNLSKSDISCCDLSHSDLSYCDLRHSYLYKTNLSNSDLRNSNLYNSNLYKSNLNNIQTNKDTLFYELQCPEEGSFIGYKKAIEVDDENVIVKLLITEDAKRSSATSEKCRCSKAKVLEITNLRGNMRYEEAYSSFDNNFIYKVDEIVSVKDFNNDRWEECTTGIHFFMSRKEAEDYFL